MYVHKGQTEMPAWGTVDEGQSGGEKYLGVNFSCSL